MQAPRQGDMIIRALVRARLFGMQILTLEARVVVGADNSSRTVAPPPHGPVGSGSRSSVPALASSGPGPGLVRAIELLEQGTETLERSRRRGYHSARDHHLSAGVRIHPCAGAAGAGHLAAVRPHPAGGHLRPDPVWCDLKRPVGHRRGHRRIHDRHLAGVGSPIWVSVFAACARLKGEPIVLVEKGKIIYRIMRRERLTLDDLAEKARISELESLDEVKWAVLETNGDISITPEEVAAHLDLAVALKSQLSFLLVYLDRQESAQA